MENRNRIPTVSILPWVAYWVIVTLLMTSLYIFYCGFFPPKVLVPGQATHEDMPKSLEQNSNNDKSFVVPKFRKAILLLVDSLRADFISNPMSGFSSVRGHITQGTAYSYRAYAHPPTVTLPRIKGLVTGGIPSFRDYANNFGSSTIDQDNLIWQLQRHSKCIAFYGDDTWIKLFPDSFTRQEGTTSFFVTDTVEVDNNVTRNIDPELEKYGSKTHLTDGTIPIPPGGERHTCEKDAEWDVLVLHYLGLDHIGHLEGPDSSRMPAKQQEMNAIFEKLYNSLSSDTVLIMAGDHGMNSDGAHGGPSEWETHPAMVIASPTFKVTNRTTKSISQIDLVPTLSLLMGIPTPMNSVGVLIDDLILDVYSNDPLSILRAYQINSDHIHRLMKTSSAICKGGNIRQYHSNSECVPSPSARNAIEHLKSATQSHRAYLKTQIQSSFEGAHQAYNIFLSSAAELFRHAQSEYDNYCLLIGIISFILAAPASCIIWKYRFSSPPTRIVGYCVGGLHLLDWILYYLFESTTSTYPSRFILSTCCGFVLSITINHVLSQLPSIVAMEILQSCFFKIVGLVSDPFSFILVFGMIIRPIAYSSSSFIEEEHLTMYFITCTALLAFIRQIAASTNDEYQSLIAVVILLISMRCTRLWNQSGFQMQGKPDIARFLNSHNLIRYFAMLVTVFIIAFYIGYQVLCLVRSTKPKSKSDRRWSIGLLCWYGCWTFGVFCITLFKLFDSSFAAKIAHFCLFVTSFGSFAALIVSFRSDHVISPSNSAQFVLWSAMAYILLVFRVCNFPLVVFWLAQAHSLMKLAQGFSTMQGVLPSDTLNFLNAVPDADSYSNRRFSALQLSSWQWGLLTYYLGQYSYFAQGNSNSLSSIDIAGAYAGLSGYQDFLVGVFVTLLLYAGPTIFQIVLAIVMLQQDQDQSGSYGETNVNRKVESLSQQIFNVLQCRLISRSWSLIIYSILVTLHRGHLFVWTVFTPKWIYENFHSIALFIHAFLFQGLSLVVTFPNSFNILAGSKGGKTTMLPK